MGRYSQRLFYGWLLVAASVANLVISGGLGFYAFGVFFNPLIDEFGWSRALLSLGMTIANFIIGIVGPIIGLLVDRYGARSVMVPGAVVFGAGFALLSLTSSLWYFYVVYFILAIGEAGILLVPVTAMIANWFERRRGLAMGVTITGFGLGGLFLAPLTTRLILDYGWRTSYLVLGLAACIILVPLNLLMIRHRPEDMGLLPDGQPQQPGRERALAGAVASNPGRGMGWTLASAARTPVFWFLAVALTMVMLGEGSILVHVVPLFRDRGFSAEAAALILACVTGISLSGRVLAGYISDKVPARYVAAAMFLMVTAGITILIITTSTMTTAILFALVYGFALGGVAALLPILVSQCFGSDSFGSIYGGLMAVTTIGFGAGPLLSGYVFDVTGSYNMAFLGFVFIALLAAGLMFLVRSPRPPSATAKP